jgi:predicted PurR-regulated permease PerM
LQLKVFIPAALGAITLYFMLKEWMKKLVYRKKLGKGKAAALLLLSSFLVVLMPIMLFVSMLSGKINYAIAHSNELIATVENFIKNIEKKYHIGITTSENLSKAGTAITNELPNVLSATFDILTTIGIMYFLLYFMLTNSIEMERWLYKYVPLKNTNIARIGKDLKQLVISNAVGIPLIALLQGIIAFVGYWILGVKDAAFWLVVTSIAAMLPFLGAALVHPLITMFGVIIGLKMFGFIGLIFGPILISMFLLLIKVYIDEFAHEENDLPNNNEPIDN